MNAPSSRLSLDLPYTLDWEGEPASPTTASPGEVPASGDAPTLRSDTGAPPDSYTPPRSIDEQWDALVGGVIDGKYRVLGEIGRGAMGVVVLAHDQTLDRRVAVKLVQSELTRAGFNDRFLEEARAMARVNHRNVVQIYACGEHGTAPYIVMELVEGSTLEDWMRQQAAPVDVGTAVRLLASVCEGVSAIHDADTVHRDIKPSNILLDAQLKPRIADLGVSTSYGRRRASRPEIVGTPAYMAPEVAFPMPEQQPTPRADVYSLACVAYQLLTGQLPFTAESESQWLLQHATAPVRAPSSIRPDLPASLDAVLLKALAKDPNDRTPSAEEFRRDLLVASEQGPEPVRILIAEDDENLREVLGDALGDEFPDAEVVRVANGAAALEILQQRPASVAILDLNMPGLNGLEVTERLRASETASHMPIVVLTGSGGPAEWRRLSSVGADRFLVKPANLDDLVASVRHSLRDRARHSDAPVEVTARPAEDSSKRPTLEEKR